MGFARTVRNSWSRTAGAPVIFLSRDRVADSLASSGLADRSSPYFCWRRGQVFAALCKTTEGHICGELDTEFRKRGRYKCSSWISNQYWLELSFDVAAIMAFVWATYKTLLIVVT
jgi:hypothetical protein